jgi:hypothetical protein
MQVPGWIRLIFGVVCIVSGSRAIKKRAVSTDVADFTGGSAARVGWLWIGMGSLCLLAVVFDIGFLKAAVRFFFAS